MKIIVRVRELRKNRNLTQEELARQLKISRQSLISLEQGRWLPSLPLAIQLAEFFGESIEQVVSSDLHVHQTPIAVAPIQDKDNEAWLPFHELQNEIDQAFDQTLRYPYGLTTIFPPIALSQDDDALYLTAEIPGFTRELIDIDVAEKAVTITGSVPAQTELNEATIRLEYQTLPFSRIIELPLPVAGHAASAKIKDGILQVILPKLKAEQPKTHRLKPTV